MEKLRVTASRSYDVVFGTDLLSSCGELVKSVLSPETAAVVSDDNVAPLYGDTVCRSLENAGIKAHCFVFPHGEASKSAGTYIRLLDFLAESGLTRTDAVVALGGGVTGDLAGFAAATYMRGVGLVQIPTSLLAMVDSSVGGKTAIDLPAGKNLCGAFYQPHLVICDLSALDTLPEEYFLDGCAEVIKYGCIGSAELLEHLKARGRSFDRSYVIPLCIGMKRNVVAGDEFDRGNRQLLNFGHTAGHVIEKLSRFSVSHGRAVAMGMVIMAEAAALAGYCSRGCADEIQGIISDFGFDTHHGFPSDEFLPGFSTDKKRAGGFITAVCPTGRGRCSLVKMSSEEFEKFISEGVIKWK